MILNKREEISRSNGSYNYYDLFFLILSLNHLPEWVQADSTANLNQLNFITAYKNNQDFIDIRHFSNHTKHIKTNRNFEINSLQNMNQWTSLSSVTTLNAGQIECKIDGRDLFEIVDNVIIAFKAGGIL